MLFVSRPIFQLKIHRSVDDHPNIIRFLGVSKGKGEKIQCIRNRHEYNTFLTFQGFEGRYLMVFDYADNGSLRKYLSTPAIKLDWSDNCQLGLDIVNGLRYIHKVGILHKDLVSVLFIVQFLFNQMHIDTLFSYVITSLRTMY